MSQVTNEKTLDPSRWIDLIEPQDFDKAFDLLFAFFQSEGFIQVPTQHRLRPPLGNLAACENPHSIVVVEFLGKKVALPQTGQMWLEDELLKKPYRYSRLFCVSYSYRNEKEPQEGRHNLIFPMFEFEMKGDIEELRALERRLIMFLGIANVIYDADYEETAESYGVREITDAEEKRLCHDYGPAVLLSRFPEHTSPFWNMKRRPDGKAEKTDGILFGIETIGSAERSTDPHEMWTHFHSISEGRYAERLYELFGEVEIRRELHYFLSHTFFPRSGGGIGMTRMIRALKLAGKI